MGRPRKQQAGEILIATDTGFWTDPKGVTHNFHAGSTTARVGSPIAKAMPHCFGPMHVDYDVEFKPETERWHGEDTEVRVHA